MYGWIVENTSAVLEWMYTTNQIFFLQIIFQNGNNEVCSLIIIFTLKYPAYLSNTLIHGANLRLWLISSSLSQCKSYTHGVHLSYPWCLNVSFLNEFLYKVYSVFSQSGWVEKKSREILQDVGVVWKEKKTSHENLLSNSNIASVGKKIYEWEASGLVLCVIDYRPRFCG